MRFTENEMTQAMAGAAKSVLAARRDVRRGKRDVDELWETMDRHQRYQLLSSLGSQVLPVLVALPDVDVAPGTRPTYSDRQVLATVEEVASDDLGRVRRAVLVRARVALVQAALAHVPPRLDPDALLGPE
ncbi:hypothetical protein H5V45_12650 [Nocardioides sp. KIGAM211]|uniref:Uncharacterized protein n=1 Tax=Nocardioides luti TaxID=2761101 RepID=A0A7X0RH07_9ACTN|nr:hypothetical protein [Nocardioides luti]